MPGSIRRPAIGLVLVAVFVFSSVVALLASLADGPLGRDLHGDSPVYSDLAYSLVAGHGYIAHRSPWPTSPALARLPLWPLLLTPGALLFPQQDEGFVVRYTGVIVHAIAALLIALLTYRIARSTVAAGIAGALFGAFPVELARVSSGDSEPAFFLFATAGLLLILGSDRGWVQACGALLSGAAVLARANYLSMPFTVGIALLLLRRESFQHWKRMLLLAAIFFVPASFWMLRNYSVSGQFPLLSTTEGVAWYCGNNAVVATELDSWGSCVVTDYFQLGRTMTEVQLNTYYRNTGIRFIRENLRSYPRLVLGKLIRSFVPVPWNDFSLISDATLGLRGMIYLIFIWLAVRGGVGGPHRIYLIGIFLITLSTTVVFFGLMRYTLCLDAYLIPSVAAGIVQEARRSQDRAGMEAGVLRN